MMEAVELLTGGGSRGRLTVVCPDERMDPTLAVVSVNDDLVGLLD